MIPYFDRNNIPLVIIVNGTNLDMTTKTKDPNVIHPKCKIPLEREAMDIKYSPSREHIVAGCADGSIRIFKSCTGEEIRKLKSNQTTDDVSITSMKFRRTEGDAEENKLLCSYSNGDVVLWRYESGTVIKTMKEERQTLGITYHAKLQKFLTVGDNGSIYLYDEETMTIEAKFEKSMYKERADGHTSRVFNAIFHPFQVNEFLSGGWDDNVFFWDMRQPTSPRFLRGPHICGDGIDFSKTGREILTCAYQKINPIQLWHYKSGKLMSNLDPDFHKSMLYCGQWLTPDFILTGGTDPSLFRIVSLRSLTTTAFYKGSTAFGVYSTDYYVKSTKNLNLKKEAQSQGDVKFMFSIDKHIIESDISL